MISFSKLGFVSGFVLLINASLCAQLDSVVHYYNLNNYDRSVELFQEIDTAAYSPEKMHEYYLQGVMVYLELGRFNNASRLVEAGMKLPVLDETKRAKLNLVAAKLYAQTGRRQQIEQVVEELGGYVENHDVDSSFYSQYLYMKVNRDMMAANYREAMVGAVDLLRYIDHPSNKREKASIYLTIGEIFRANDYLRKALYYYKKAEEMARKVNALSLIAKAYNNQSIIYMNLGDTVTSIEMLHQSIFYHQQSENQSSTAAAQYNLGWLYLNTKDFAQAKNQFRKVIDIGELYGHQMALYYGYFGIGLYYSRVGSLKDAEYYLFKALAIARKSNNVSGIGRVYESFSNVYQKFHRFEKALHYFQKVTHLRDSIKMEEQKSLVEGLETKYNLELKEKENKELKLQQAERDAVIARQKLSFFVTGAVVVLLFFVLVFLYVAIRNKEKKNQFLEVQRKRMDDKNRQLQRLNDEAAEQKSQLEEMNEIKDSMFSIISHDLRSPLSSVFMLMKMFEQGDIDQERGVGMLGELSCEVSQSLFLLNNLLTWANINLKGVNPDMRKVRLDDVLEESIDFFQSEFSRKNITINYSIDPQHFVHADEFMLKSIVQNLISNAMKFSYENASVSIRAIEHSEKIILTIFNEGPEPDQAMLEEIFVPGVRLGRGTKNERGGGLGLTIVSIYTNAIGGSLDFKSNNNTNIIELKLPIALT
ncbi:MAG: tetratricopeptide repeat-containing sensor histidine kinase [Salinivirgaceae bacterium]|jgi:two-component system sensor histidine kinase/response regulator|nr:tetratricopeptide repeat-containing sensor histidine kinase [Salinivirgaceae bacterium]